MVTGPTSQGNCELQSVQSSPEPCTVGAAPLAGPGNLCRGQGHYLPSGLPVGTALASLWQPLSTCSSGALGQAASGGEGAGSPAQGVPATARDQAGWSWVRLNPHGRL